jgi:hypothetical protein
MFVSCVYVVLSCVGRGLFDGLITRPEVSYRAWLTLLNEKPQRRSPKPDLGLEP